jgi:ubiquinol-cytochrome c reductase cytochrome c subunit
MMFARCLVAVMAIALLGAAPDTGTRMSQGHDIYATRCSTCHGPDGHGTKDGPTLRGAGAADVDFWVSSGRMPAAESWVQTVRKPSLFTRAQTDALIAYVTSFAPGGTPLLPPLREGNLAHGRELYTENCEHCHGAFAQGEAIGGQWFAPDLKGVPPLAIAEAIRVGPEPMPHWGERTLSRADIDDLVTYVERTQTHADDLGGLGLGHIGPVAEGIVAWIVGIALVLAFIRGVGTND